MNYYDSILAGIGFLMVFGAGLAFLFGPAALVATSVIAVGVVGHAMFINGPTAYADEQKSARPQHTPEQALGRDASDSSLPQGAPQLDD